MLRPPFSTKLERVGWLLLPVSGFAIVALIYQQTALVCEYGPRPPGLIAQMRPIWIAAGLALFVWMLLAVWFFVVAIYLLLKKPANNRRQKLLILLAALILAPGLVGNSIWHRIVLHTCGPGKFGYPLLSESARQGDISSVEFLFARGYELDFEGGWFWDSPLIAAIRGNQPRMVRYLISKGVKVNRPPTKYIGTPLMVAAEVGKTEIAKILVEAGADICQKNEEGETAIDIARSRRNRRTLTYLQEKQTCH